MLEEVPIGIALLDATDFHVISANRCFRALFANTVMERQQTSVARDLTHIFERFHRAANVDHAISGLGIGLYLAREIIMRHGGAIRAESQEGQGSTFFILLPL